MHNEVVIAPIFVMLVLVLIELIWQFTFEVW
jgi:hypothetical protein